MITVVGVSHRHLKPSPHPALLCHLVVVAVLPTLLAGGALPPRARVRRAVLLRLVRGGRGLLGELLGRALLLLLLLRLGPARALAPGPSPHGGVPTSASRCRWGSPPGSSLSGQAYLPAAHPLRALGPRPLLHLVATRGHHPNPFFCPVWQVPRRLPPGRSPAVVTTGFRLRCCWIPTRRSSRAGPTHLEIHRG